MELYIGREYLELEEDLLYMEVDQTEDLLNLEVDQTNTTKELLKM